MTNPWNLSAVQIEAIKATIECDGREKITAEKLGVSRMTLTNRVVGARKRMGVETRIAALLAFDRWTRANAKEAA